MRLLGIDPGTASTGYGIIDVTRTQKTNKFKSIDYGLIKTSKDHLMPYRLLKIYNSGKHLVETHNPDAIVIEKLFFNTNVKTAMTVGQARGLFVMLGGEYNLPVFEYTALQAKMVLTGYGRSDKKEVREKVAETLNIRTKISPIDASDALAMAICHTVKTGEE